MSHDGELELELDICSVACALLLTDDILDAVSNVDVEHRQQRLDLN